jgi:hypothetical protein
MGRVFPLIADAALVAEDPAVYTECQVCGTRGVPVYAAQGYLTRGDGSADPSRDVYAACEACLKGGLVAHLHEYRTDPLIERFAADPAGQRALLRTTPRIPFQCSGDDWPLCCGQLAEFAGSPASLVELIQVQAAGSYWDLGKKRRADYDARRDGPPESWREVSLFRCLKCQRLYWVFQPS